MKTNGPLDTVWPGSEPVVSTRLRSVLEPLVGHAAQFLPVTINDDTFWVIKVNLVVDALDLERTEFFRSDGAIHEFEKPVWIGNRIESPALFRIPMHEFRHKFFATAEVKEAYEASGCGGMRFWFPGEVI
nr:hypothetical protein [Nocardioides marmoriginsengisoli]